MVLSDCKISILCKRKQGYTIKYNKKEIFILQTLAYQRVTK